MPTNNPINPTPESDQPQEDVVDLRKLFFKMLSYWHFFVLALAVALICAWLYNRYTTTRYRVTSTLLIEEDKKSGTIGTDQLLQGFGLRPGMQNLDNQILILSSWSLIGRTLDSLPFDIEYYYRGRIKKAGLYPKHPVKVIQDTAGSLPFDIEFKFKYLGDNKFTLDAESYESYTLHKQASFGEKIEVKSGSFRIE